MNGQYVIECEACGWSATSDFYLSHCPACGCRVAVRVNVVAPATVEDTIE